MHRNILLQRLMMNFKFTDSFIETISCGNKHDQVQNYWCMIHLLHPNVPIFSIFFMWQMLQDTEKHR